MTSTSKTKVAYFYDVNVSNFYYGKKHPMKPHRLAMANSLIVNYDLISKMDVYKPRRASTLDLIQFHSEEYIEFLKRVTPDTINKQETRQFCIFGECPPFPSVYEFCQLYTGASLDAATKINHKLCDIAINWAGGLHHARKDEASGFCYVNDIVLAIIELLKYHPRVLYIDIDVHHGDGVQDAFYLTDRVMTLSFHKYGGEFFPGTGDTIEVGKLSGKYYSLNVPFRDGVDDDSYRSLFEPIVESAIQKFRPSVIVLQCGADSLRGDRIGTFNLSLEGHGDCIRFVKKFGIPLMILGGGGYTIKNVARLWAYETSILVDTPVNDKIPEFDEYYEHYAPNHVLCPIEPIKYNNQNSPGYVNHIREIVLEQLRHLDHAPSVQMQYIPPDFFVSYDEFFQGVDDTEEFSEADYMETIDDVEFDIHH
jgi:histone deacetylase 3